MNTEFKNNLTCPICRNKFRLFNSFLCESCNTEFPVLNNNIPILLLNPKEILSNAYLNYTKFINELKSNISSIAKISELKQDNIQINLIAAYKHNIEIFKYLKKAIEPFINPESIAELVIKGFTYSPYNQNLSYVKRDWGMFLESEREIRRIILELNKLLLLKEFNNSSAIFLGAGLGRIAYEYTNTFNSVYALDVSPTMAIIFNFIKQNDFKYYEINLSNIGSKNQKVQEIIIHKNNSLNEKNNLHYILTDCRNLPFKSNSISFIASIYFTDVIPPSKLILEVKRVLINGGVFIHYGPLFYHFNEVEEMISYEELKELLTKNGFCILQENNFFSNHCEPFFSYKPNYYYNWVISAKKI